MADMATPYFSLQGDGQTTLNLPKVNIIILKPAKQTELIQKSQEKIKRNTNFLFKCAECGKCFELKSYLSRHEIRVHGKKSRARSVGSIGCSYCDKKFHRKAALSAHRIAVHGERVRKLGIECKEPNCKEAFAYLTKFREHLHDFHGLINMGKRVELKFNTREDFESWLSVEEEKTRSHYILCSTKRCENSSTLNYECNRSGSYKSISKGKRQAKAQGSKKIGFHCTSQIRVRDRKSHVEVLYFPEHYRHDKSLWHLPIPKTVKRTIAEKLSKGVDMTKIIQDVKLTMNADLEREHLLTRQDVKNIRRQFDAKFTIGQPVIENDIESLHSWVKDVSQQDYNPVLLFKTQDAHYPDIDSDTFLFILMTAFQKSVIAEFDYDRVCIICIDGICNYDFKVVVLVVSDHYEEALPVAFCITSAANCKTMYTFFSHVKQAVPHLNPMIYMGEDECNFYTAWEKVFGPCNECFICPWSAEKSWQTHLCSIKRKEDKDKIYTTLKTLMYEGDKDRSSDMLDLLEKQLKENEDTKEFYRYFISQYYNRYKMWAYCFRKNAKIHTSMHVGTFRKNLRRWYLSKNKRIDNLVVRLINLANDKKFDALIKSRKKIENLVENVQCYETSECTTFENNANIKWDIVSESGESYYVVKNHVCSEECPISCSSLNSSYKCTCCSYATSNQPCKHINFMLKYIQEHNTVVYDDSNDVDNDNFISDRPVTENTQSVNFESVKLQLKEICTKLNSIEYLEDNRLEQVEIQGHINAIELLLNCSNVELSQDAVIYMPEFLSKNQKTFQQEAFVSATKVYYDKNVIVPDQSNVINSAVLNETEADEYVLHKILSPDEQTVELMEEVIIHECS